MLFSNSKIKYLITVISLIFINMSFLLAGNRRQSILEYGPSVRALALGEAVAGFPIDDPGISFFNPALIQNVESMNLGGSYWSLYDGAMYNHLGVNMKSFGFNVMQFSRTNIKKYTSIADPGTDISNRQTIIYGSYGKSYWGYNFGLGLKYLSYDIDTYNDWGLSFDLGAQKEIGSIIDRFDNNLSVGAVCKNILQKAIKLDQEKERQPISLEAGASMKVNLREEDVLNILLDFEAKDSHFLAKLGAEYIYRNMFALRTGYKDGFNLGLGFIRGKVSLDYSYVIKDLDGFHRIGIVYRFKDTE
ncbi:PorV/PorQ family protein [bacterium]